MHALGGGPTAPVEQITELGETILEKLIAAGITTVEELADMTPEQLEEVPGIGEKTVEKISVAVRHYFGQYEEGEERPVVAAVAGPTGALTQPAAAESASEAVEGEMSNTETPEELLAKQAGAGAAEEIREISTEDIEAAEEAGSDSDAFSDADTREERIERTNDAVDGLVEQAQETAKEGPDTDGHDRG